MGRAKKDGEHLHCYVKSALFEELKDYCERTARNQTAVVERALSEYLQNHADDKN